MSNENINDSNNQHNRVLQDEEFITQKQSNNNVDTDNLHCDRDPQIHDLIANIRSSRNYSEDIFRNNEREWGSPSHYFDEVTSLGARLDDMKRRNVILEQPRLSVIYAVQYDVMDDTYRDRLTNSLRQMIHFHWSFIVEVVIVAWNIPPGISLLEDTAISKLLDDHETNSMALLRVINVGTNYLENQKLLDKNCGVYEYWAKNIGMRRAKGQWILTTNSNVVFSHSLLHYLNSEIGNQRLNSNVLYSAARLELDEEKLQNAPPYGYLTLDANCKLNSRVENPTCNMDREIAPMATISDFMLLNQEKLFKSIGGGFLQVYQNTNIADEFYYRQLHMNKLEVNFIECSICTYTKIAPHLVSGQPVWGLNIKDSWNIFPAPKSRSCNQVAGIRKLVSLLDKGYFPANLYSLYAKNEVTWGYPGVSFPEHISLGWDNDGDYVTELPSSYHSDHRPILSVVVVSRNDGYGVTGLDRLIRCFQQLFNFAWSIKVEVVLVEWNSPVGGRPHLYNEPRIQSILRDPKRSSMTTFRSIFVADPYASLLNLNGFSCGVFEYPAKNVAFRRSFGRYVVSINADGIFSTNLVNLLDKIDIEDSIRDNEFFTAVRMSLQTHLINWRSFNETFLIDNKCNVIDDKDSLTDQDCRLERSSRDTVNVGDFELISRDSITRNFGGGFLEIPQGFGSDSEWLSRNVNVHKLKGVIAHCPLCHQQHARGGDNFMHNIFF